MNNKETKKYIMMKVYGKPNKTASIQEKVIWAILMVVLFMCTYLISKFIFNWAGLTGVLNILLGLAVALIVTIYYWKSGKLDAFVEQAQANAMAIQQGKK